MLKHIWFQCVSSQTNLGKICHYFCTSLMTKQPTPHQTLILGLWFDVETSLGLSCILPLLECMQVYSKFIHSHDLFICVFIDGIKACEKDMYKMYVNLIMNYGHTNEFFQIFLAIVNHIYDYTYMAWIS